MTCRQRLQSNRDLDDRDNGSMTWPDNEVYRGRSSAQGAKGLESAEAGGMTLHISTANAWSGVVEIGDVLVERS